MHSLDEILSSGKYHPAVETVLKRAEEVTSRESAGYRAALAKREAARQAVLDLMSAKGVTAFVYPTLRRKPAAIGQPQGGSNCQLSATTGLPAISMPAGFTKDGLPVGMELLGKPVERADAVEGGVRVRAARCTSPRRRRRRRHSP